MSTTTTTGAGLEGVVAGESEICYIDGYAGILSYRGYNIHTLAENATFEEVIWLLWKGMLPKQDELDQLKADLFAHYAIPAPVVDFLKGQSEGRADGRAAHGGVDAQPVRSGGTRHVTRSQPAQGAKLMSQTATIVTTFGRLRKVSRGRAGPGLDLRAISCIP